MLIVKAPSLINQIVTGLCSRLAPYFLVNHPARGVMAGPFAKLPQHSMSTLRKMAVELVGAAISNARETPAAQELLHSAQEALVGLPEIEYLDLPRTLLKG